MSIWTISYLHNILFKDMFKVYNSMNYSWSDETLPNYIKTKRLAQKGNGRNNKKRAMSNPKTTPKNTNKQMGTTKERNGDLPKETKKKLMS